MKVLVTGATGFLGNHLVSALAVRGDEVRALSRGTGGESRRQETSIEIVRGDLKDRDSLRKAIAGVDVVCHAAAAMRGSWREYVETTIQGTEWMLKLSQEAGVKRFVHISSITVYRTWDHGREALIDETFPWDPDPVRLGPYVHSKIEAEKHAFRYLRQGLPVVVIRPGIIYGPGGRLMHPNVGYFVTKKVFLLVGGGDNPLPLTYVDNTIDGILLAISSDKAVGQVYNLVDGDAITQKEFLDRYRAAVDDRFVTLSLPLSLLLAGAVLARHLKRFGMTSIVTTAYGLRAQYANVRFDAAKARRDLGWQPHITLKEGLRRTFSVSA
jgi:2-alkyl-3-oxoalkanoate reductase